MFILFKTLMKTLKWFVILLVMVFMGCNDSEEKYSNKDAFLINEFSVNEFIVFDEVVSIGEIYETQFKDDFSNWTNLKVKRIIKNEFPLIKGKMTSYEFQLLTLKFLHISNQWLVRLLSNKRNKKDGAYIVNSLEGSLTVKIDYFSESKVNAYTLKDAPKLKDFKTLKRDLKNYLRSEQAEKFSAKEELYILEEPISIKFYYRPDDGEEKLIIKEIGRRITIFPKSTILKEKNRFEHELQE